MIELRLLGGLAVVGPDSLSDAPTPNRRRRSLALLALVAASAPRPVGREKLLGFLWPESDAERARNSLRQAIFSLRREFNEDNFLPESAGGVQLDPAHLRVDLWEFREALQRKAPAEAIAAYRGPFLDGFDIRGLTELSQWVEAERESLHRQYMEGLDVVARDATARGKYDEAVAWRRRQAAADPLSSRIALALLKALSDAGDRSGALKYAGTYERNLREQLDAEPDPAVMGFVDSLRISPVRSQPPVVFDERAAQRAAAPPSVPAPVAPAAHASVAAEPSAPSGTTQVAAGRAVTRNFDRYERRLILAGAGILIVLGAIIGRFSIVEHTDAAPAPAADLGPMRILASGAKSVANRDPASRLIECDGPACPKESLPQPAYVLVKHAFYAAVPSGSSYIGPVPDATMAASPGYACCTTAKFENVFALPATAVSATITVSLHADNHAAVSINGVEFGRQKDKWDAGNYLDMPDSYTLSFKPDPSGTNRLHVTLWDGGGALGLHYNAIVTYDALVDADSDGIPDNADQYPTSDRRPTVAVGGCDAGVANRTVPDVAGATFNDMIAGAGNRSDSVGALAQSWSSRGLISKQDLARITACAK
jgi:DNA-binding SARP family transcriptional activator